MGLPNRAAFGDMFSEDKAKFSSWIGVKALIIPAMKMVVPIVGGLLSRIDLYLPFKVSAAVAALNMLTPLLYKEPLRPHQRLPFKEAGVLTLRP